MNSNKMQIGKAALWMTGAIASFTSMAIAGRELSVTHDTFEIMFYRSLVGICVVAIVLSASRKWHQVTTERLGLHGIRNVLHFTGQNLWFYAVTVIPLAQVFALEFTQPIWVILLSPLLLHERLTALRLTAALIGFAGILIVARPGAATLSPGVIAAAASAIFFALTAISTKILNAHSQHRMHYVLAYFDAGRFGSGCIRSGWANNTSNLNDCAASFACRLGRPIGPLLYYQCPGHRACDRGRAV